MHQKFKMFRFTQDKAVSATGFPEYYSCQVRPDDTRWGESHILIWFLVWFILKSNAKCFFLLWIVVCTAHFINYKSWKAKSWKILWISETELIKFELCSKLINAKTASRNNAPTTMQVDCKFIWREIFFKLEMFFWEKVFAFRGYFSLTRKLSFIWDLLSFEIFQGFCTHSSLPCQEPLVNKLLQHSWSIYIDCFFFFRTQVPSTAVQHFC